MLPEVLNYLNCKPGKIYVDCTIGGSGHARAVCDKILPDGLLIGIDQDIVAVENARKVLKPFEFNVRLFHDDFVNLPNILKRLEITAVDGILLDLGVSLFQIESSGRGFSFKKDEPLDMRMNQEASTKAEDLINNMEGKNLRKIFQEYGEERWAGQIARKIVKERKRKSIRSSLQLARIVYDAVPGRAKFNQKIHPATRVFMALRIAVNKELEKLDLFMANVANLLSPKGRLCILSFHSLEDRIVKTRIRDLEKTCVCPPDFPKCVCNKKREVCSLTKKPVRPSEEEIIKNPMARSAKLRAMERI
jgi:16S rRNA (cytosine1402-N4)-methyltransferase